MSRPASSLRRFLLFWNAVNLLLLVLIVGHQSTVPEVLGRYTRLYAAGIGLALLLAAAVLICSIWGQRRLSALRPRISSGWGVIGALGVLALTTVVWMLSVDAELIKLLLTFNLACVGMGAAWTTGTDIETRRYVQAALIAVLAVVLVVALFSAHHAPVQQTSGDEAAWANMAVTWLETRQVYFHIGAWTPLPATPGYGYWAVALAGWMQIFGISLASSRLFIWVTFVLVVLAITVAGWKLYDRWVGLFAGVIAAGSSYVLTTRIIRPELGLPIIGALLLILYLRKQPLWALVIGALAVLSLEIHASGLAYIVGVGGLYFTDLFLHRTDPLRFRRFGFFLVGGIIGSALYVWLNILSLPNPSYFFDALRGQHGFLNGYSWQWLLSGISMYGERAPLEIILIVFGAIGLLLRRSNSDRILLRFLAFTSLGYALFVPGGERYLILFAPFFYLAIASLFRFGLDAGSVERRRVAGGMLAVFCLCSPGLAQMLPAVQLNILAADAAPLHVRRVHERTSPATVVAGDINDYWWFINYDQFYGNGAEYDHDFEIRSGDTGLWQRLKPDIVYFTAYPGNPTIAPLLKRWVDEMDYSLVDTVESDGFTTLIWQRPGYNAPAPEH